MKEDSLRRLIAFFFKYLWAVCALIIGVNFTSMMITAYSIMENTAEEGLTSLSTELAHRVQVNYALLDGLKDLPQLSDTSIPVEERAASLKPFASAFHLWMIGVVDPDGMIASTRDNRPARVARDYIPRIIQTKQREMSDIFPAGATGDLNFSQFMPVIHDGKVVSIVFTATLLTQLDELLTRKAYESSGYYLLADSNQEIVSHPSQTLLNQKLADVTKNETFLGARNRQLFLEDLQEGRSGSLLSFFDGTMFYTVYERLPDTQWTVVHRVRVLQTFRATLVGFALQSALYLLVFAGLYFLGTNYVKRKLEPVDNILKQVIDLNKAVHNSDSISDEDAASLLHISRKGLRDELTDLPTRMLFRQMLNQWMLSISEEELSAVFYIDMDNLKSINDSLGHDFGDLALIALGRSLSRVTETYHGLCARYGGDEFVMFVEHLHSTDEARAIAQELLNSLHGMAEKDGECIEFHVSIGIAFYPLHARSIDVVIQLADIALYEVKQNGKAGYAVYSPEGKPAKNEG